ncbi:hypothetical protein OF83DRAFT_766695 [Amylostereum chailletii]|nr:hypothetical protein OF83DRAFT_766695 [Amylostereum chailletii]
MPFSLSWDRRPPSTPTPAPTTPQGLRPQHSTPLACLPHASADRLHPPYPRRKPSTFQRRAVLRLSLTLRASDRDREASSHPGTLSAAQRTYTHNTIRPNSRRGLDTPAEGRRCGRRHRGGERGLAGQGQSKSKLNPLCEHDRKECALPSAHLARYLSSALTSQRVRTAHTQRSSLELRPSPCNCMRVQHYTLPNDSEDAIERYLGAVF